MDRLYKLEKQWLIYKAKQIAKKVAVVALATLLGGGVVYLSFQTYNDEVVDSKEQSQVLESRVVESKEEPKNAVSAPVYQKRDGHPLTLAPDYSFEKDIKNRLRTPVATQIRQEPQVRQTPVAQQTGVVSRVTTIEALESGYKKSPSYNKAIEIADYHLKQGENAKAIKWALKANEIDSSDEASWEIFAIASKRDGQTEKAINALKSYLDVKPSEKLSKLLADLEER